jgi:alkyl hydroperoxide reductase subunit AhpC
VNSSIAWQQKDVGLLRYPLCSDFYPHGAVARSYGVLREGEPVPGISERAVFVVDKRGRIVFREVYHLGQTPENEDVLQVLRELKSREEAASTGA